MGRTTRIGEVSWQLRAQAVLSRDLNLGLVYQLSCLANPHTSNYNLRLCLRFARVGLCVCVLAWHVQRPGFQSPTRKKRELAVIKLDFFLF